MDDRVDWIQAEQQVASVEQGSDNTRAWVEAPEVNLAVTWVSHIVDIRLSPQQEQTEIASLMNWFDRFVLEKQTFNWTYRQKPLQSSLWSVSVIDWYDVKYPQLVIDVLWELYQEYNLAFSDLIIKNRENDGDYKYTFDENWNPTNYFVQIDMTWLPEWFLDEVERWSISKRQLKEILRNRIFELENSLAMYQLLSVVFSRNWEPTRFWETFRWLLDKLREKHWKPIALLAVTQEKYEAMLLSEFWSDSQNITPDKVKDLSWFDAFFWPEQFQRMLDENGWKCPYLLYTRSSLPVSQLRNPEDNWHASILDDDNLRRIVKENSITYNVDSSSMAYSDRINDTKEYQQEMWIAFWFDSIDELFTKEFLEHLRNGKQPKVWTLYSSYSWPRLSEKFREFIEKRWVDSTLVDNWEIKLRFKPMKEAYWCYWHLSGSLDDKKLRAELSRNLRRRWSYVVQVDMLQPKISDEADEREFTYIDRVFFWINPQNWAPTFMWWFRSLMPLDTEEAKKWRNHWNSETQWVEIK